MRKIVQTRTFEKALKKAHPNEKKVIPIGGDIIWTQFSLQDVALTGATAPTGYYFGVPPAVFQCLEEAVLAKIQSKIETHHSSMFTLR